MAKKKTTGIGAAFSPLNMLILFLLILLGMWIYYQQKAPQPSAAKKETPEEQRIRQLMKENPDAEIFQDAENEPESKKKSPLTNSQP